MCVGTTWHNLFGMQVATEQLSNQEPGTCALLCSAVHTCAACQAIIKVPMTLEGLKAISHLSKQGVSTNCTLVFSANQALMAARAGAYLVSPFVGRLDDIGHDGMQVGAGLLLLTHRADSQTADKYCQAAAGIPLPVVHV